MKNTKLLALGAALAFLVATLSTATGQAAKSAATPARAESKTPQGWPQCAGGWAGPSACVQAKMPAKKATEIAESKPTVLTCDESAQDPALSAADNLAEYGRNWTRAQVSPAVADFGWGGFHCRSDSSGLHESLSFTQLNGSIRRVTYCFLSADRKTRRCAIFND